MSGPIADTAGSPTGNLEKGPSIADALKSLGGTIILTQPLQVVPDRSNLALMSVGSIPAGL